MHKRYEASSWFQKASKSLLEEMNEIIGKRPEENEGKQRCGSKELPEKEVHPAIQAMSVCIRALALRQP